MSTYPILLAGQRFTSAVATSMLYDYTVKQANQTNVTTTLVNDTELVTPTLGIGTWDVEFEFLWSAAVASAMKTQWLTTGTMAGPKRINGPWSGTSDNGDNVTTRFQASAYTTPIIYGPRTATGTAWTKERAIVTVTVAGTITFQWAQSLSSAVATTIFAGSYVKVKQIA